MRNSARYVTTFFLAIAVGQTLSAQEAFPFKEGDRVMFLGESITEQYQYSNDIKC